MLATDLNDKNFISDNRSKITEREEREKNNRIAQFSNLSWLLREINYFVAYQEACIL